MKRVLIICHYFPPENRIGAVRPAKIAKYLSKSENYSVTVLTTQPKNVAQGSINEDTGIYEIIRVKGLLGSNTQNENKDTTYLSKRTAKTILSDFIKKNRKIGHLCHVAKNAYELNKYIHNGKKYLKSDSNTYDIVISTYNTEFGHRIALWYKKKNKHIRWIADFRDSTWMNDSSLIKKVFGSFFAYRVAKNCNDITVVADGIYITHKKEFHDKKVFLLPNGYDTEERIKQCHCDKTSFRIVYTGELYNGKRDIRPVFEALSQLAIEGKIDLQNILFIYAGKSGNNFKEQINDFPQIRHEDKGFIDRSESLMLQAEADALVLCSWCGPREKHVITGKFYEYLNAYKPLICTISGNESGSALREIIMNYHLGICYEEAKRQNDKQLLMNYIEFLYNNKMKGCVEYNPDQEFIQKYDYVNIVKKLLTIIDNQCLPDFE